MNGMDKKFQTPYIDRSRRTMRGSWKQAGIFEDGWKMLEGFGG